ncbi:E3 ubiquitin-protein ligase rnf146-like isoform X1 [Ptychodera flava]|uniref:E3 ubiquitin-protein ligase rnf146-like isoform X1 n=1 Tax=Ptychodera flava TaxID=63121 RepID=UPI00396A0526
MAESESTDSIPDSSKGDQSKTERKTKGVKKSDLKTDSQEDSDHKTPVIDIPECAVCLQTCVQPVQLPCGHIFCFLCVKGVANQSKRCALCRNEIPMEFLNCPTLVEPIGRVQPSSTDAKDKYSWFYEGRNGWWKYDERTTVELEEAYKQKNRCVELLIAGFLYVIDYENMIQIRRNDPTRRRRIKRDLSSVPTKGIAGIKYLSSSRRQDERQGDGNEMQSTDSVVSKVTASPGGDQDVHTTTAHFSAMTLSDQNDGVDTDDEAETTYEVVVSSTGNSGGGDQTSMSSGRSSRHHHVRSPNSLANMSSQALREGIQSLFPQGLRLRRGARRQNRRADNMVSREEYMATESEFRDGRHNIPSCEDTVMQSRYDGDVESSGDDDD